MSLQNIIEICVAIDIAILGIAYPIIVDKISNIGDKYKSQYIPVLFNYEFPQRSISITIRKKQFRISIFKLTLYLTLISLLFLIFQLPPTFNWNNFYINNSAKLIVFGLSTFLTVFFFIWLDKVILYNGKSTSILSNLKRRHEKLKNDSEKRQYILKAINEITFYAIEKQDEHLQETLLEFYYNVFGNIRRNHDKDKPLIYPVDLYFLVHKLNIESVNGENKKLRAIEHRAVSGSWLLGEGFDEIPISDETYSWLWRNIYTICDEPRLMKMFWANSFQYFDYRLRPITPEYNEGFTEIINQKEQKNREIDRDKFIEFHYALGGLVYYRKHYELIKYFFEYSQSNPPRYVLLPGTMTQIFHWFEYFRNDIKNRTSPIDSKFYFPELDNLGSSGQIKYWICSYIAILFIRQYSLHKDYVLQDFTGFPSLPENVMELSAWLDSISYFKKCLNDVIENETLLSELKFDTIVNEKQDDFINFIDNLKNEITDRIGQQKLEAPLSEEKIQSFYNKSNEIITKAFKQYDSILVKYDREFAKSELKISINGEKSLMSKSAFTEGDIPHFNFDTIFAQTITVNKIRQIIPNSFALSRTKRYLLNRNNILIGINKIIGSNKEIVIIGINIGFQTKKLLDESAYSNQIEYITSSRPLFRDVLFILRKNDLPAIEYRDIKEEEIQELKLVSINDHLKIYASVIDINTHDNRKIKDKWNLENQPDNLDFKVQIAITFLSTIYWKNERNVVQINLASEFEEQGIENSINDIEPILTKLKGNR
ncbi:MAG: hypothetical protein KQI35_14370 [Bacteroidetes bacterium]|nr:hypothetical protein [Bacteroidota bacterium]